MLSGRKDPRSSGPDCDPITSRIPFVVPVLAIGSTIFNLRFRSPRHQGVSPFLKCDV